MHVIVYTYTPIYIYIYIYVYTYRFTYKVFTITYTYTHMCICIYIYYVIHMCLPMNRCICLKGTSASNELSCRDLRLLRQHLLGNVASQDADVFNYEDGSQRSSMLCHCSTRLYQHLLKHYNIHHEMSCHEPGCC